MNDNLYYIWLSLACGAGSADSDVLLARYKTAKRIFESDIEEIKNDDKVSLNDNILSCLADKKTERAEKILEYCERHNVTVINCDSPLYPKRLRYIRSFPVVLYFKGHFADFDDNLCVAMVGTREMTDYGKYTAYDLAAELARCGAIIVSGMALGIDSAAHKGCLYANGYTAAVLGCGIDKVYPPENKHLMDRIMETGVVLTEYPPFTEPKGKNFPVRNRIMSGLSQAVAIIEAGFKSGALITARVALSQGKRVFAVPGNINSPNSKGTNNLIRNGAGILLEAYDILNEYEYTYGHKINIENSKYYGYNNSYGRGDYIQEKRNNEVKDTDMINIESKGSIIKKITQKIKEQNTTGKNQPAKKKPDEINIDLNENERKIIEIFYKNNYNDLSPDALTVDGLEMREVLIALTSLELYGLVESCPGGLYKPVI